MSPLEHPRVAITSDDRVTIDGVVYRAFETRPNYLLVPQNDRNCDPLRLDLADFDEISNSDRFTIQRNFYSPRAGRARQLACVDSIVNLRLAEQEKILHRMEWCDRHLALEANTAAFAVGDRITRSDEKMKVAVRLIARDLLEKKLKTTTRADQKEDGGFRAPGPRTLLKWVTLYELAGFNALALRDQRFRSGDRSLRFDNEVYALMVKYRHEYLNPRQPLLKDIHEKMVKEIAAINETRSTSRRKPLVAPNQDTFSSFIRSLGEYAVYAGRKGVEAANRKYYITNGGQLITRIGQLVEIDEWTVQLHKLLILAGIYEAFSPEERQLIEKTRWSLSVAEDVATRCILGMRLAPTASTENALKTLEMIFADKSSYADDAECQTPWRQRTGLAMVRSDNGSPYLSDRFRLALVAVGAAADRTPAGRPQLKGHVERFFSTIAMGLTTMFEGRTFKDIVAGAHYPSEARAVLTVEELGQVIVRFVVDIYHNTPHSGLDGATPAETWDRLERETGVIPLPDKNTRRAVFGRKQSRRVTPRGVEFAGLFYQDERIQALRRKLGDDDCRVEVAVDLSDLGHVSVRLEDGWAAIPCSDDGMRGVSFASAAEVARQVAQARAEGRSNLPAIVGAARRSMRELNNKAMRRANIASLDMTDKQLEAALKDLNLGFSTPEQPKAKCHENATQDLLDGGFDTSAPDTQSAPPQPSAAAGKDFDLEDMS